MTYKCPICGYRSLVSPPENNTICPCCGTEFGYDDAVKSHDNLRNVWINRGAPWFSDKTPKPAGWNPIVQLAIAGFLPIQITGKSLSGNEKPTRLGEPLDYDIERKTLNL